MINNNKNIWQFGSNSGQIMVWQARRFLGVISQRNNAFQQPKGQLWVSHLVDLCSFLIPFMALTTMTVIAVSPGLILWHICPTHLLYALFFFPQVLKKICFLKEKFCYLHTLTILYIFYAGQGNSTPQDKTSGTHFLRYCCQYFRNEFMFFV